MVAPGDITDSKGEKASAPPDCTAERIPFCLRMSLTISASAGDPRLCSATNFASLESCIAVSEVNRFTSSDSSSGHRVIPGSYSDSQTGQNIFDSNWGTVGFWSLCFVLCAL